LHGLDPKILHRDLKSSNLLLFNKYLTLKICDFGTARTLATVMSGQIGTAGYMAPEVCLPHEINIYFILTIILLFHK